MGTDREALGRFLTDNAVNEAALALVRPACGLFDPFFIAADSGALTLSPIADIDEAAAAVAAATGAKVETVIPMSLIGLTAGPGWAGRPGPQPAARKTALWDRKTGTLKAALDTAHWTKVQARLPAPIVQDLCEKLSSAIWQDLQPVLAASLPEQAALAYWDAFMIILGYVLLGDSESFGRLSPLLDLLSQNVPLGEKDGEPGTWLVLTA